MKNLDVADPFRTVLREQDRQGEPNDPKEEALALAVREALIEELISGEGYLDSTLDCLAQQGINPDAWLGQVEANINYVIDSGIRFTTNENGLFLPDRRA